mmetsp:Transcript_37942/g.55989  ORF Transcript_37942/g.55989 Transcript_37942/m.55989 type:complete len:127 (-) Transcript_37942:22-402(-)
MITPKSSTDFVPYDCALVEMSEARSMNGHVRLSDKRWTGLLGSFSHGSILFAVQSWDDSFHYGLLHILHPTSLPILSLTARESSSTTSLRPTARHLCLFLFVCFLLLIPLFSETDPVSLSSSSFNI